MREQVREAYRVVTQHWWSLEDLQKMSDENSTSYQRARAAEIPEGMARGFKRELHIFKPQWRASRDLMCLGQQQR
jgi:hypothetical protein